MQGSLLRRPAVAGRFYPSDPDSLTREINRHLGARPWGETRIEDAKACVAPHAGYMYSGAVAAAVYRRLPPVASFVILGPNHFGRGTPLAIVSSGEWLTPLGRAPVDAELAAAVRSVCLELVEDADAHEGEHSLEVQIPFLQCVVGTFSFVPIALGGVPYATLCALGHAIARAIHELGRPVLIVASSDMNHYEPDGITRVKDRMAIDRMLALDPEGLYEVVQRERISMCGIGPAVVMLHAAKKLNAREALLEKYATSADAGGDAAAVVGYAGMIIR
jgi:MEMO1 family protein